MKKTLRKNPGSIKEAQERREALREYRGVQVALAIFRDNATCVNCYRFRGQVKTYDHVHHTEGRGTYEREHYTKLICLCVDCHMSFSAMRQPDKAIHRAQRKLIKFANEHPINLHFTPPEKN